VRALWNKGLWFAGEISFAFLRTTRRAVSQRFIILSWLCVVGRISHCWSNWGATWDLYDIIWSICLALLA
jgi:hypothetical protein